MCCLFVVRAGMSKLSGARRRGNGRAIVTLAAVIRCWAEAVGASRDKALATHVGLLGKLSESWSADQNVSSDGIVYSEPVFIQH